MNKNVLVIPASPREGGNSGALCGEFIRGAQESGNHAEKIFLASKNIKYRIGCDVCSTIQKCVQKDDMAEILDKVVEADVIVLVTPMYLYTMDAQTKTLIDRTVPRYTEIQNKDFYSVIAAADTEQKMTERTIGGSRGFTQDCLTGAREKGIIYGIGAWQVGETKETPAMKQTYEVGRNVQLRNKTHDGLEGVSCIFCVLQL